MSIESQLREALSARADEVGGAGHSTRYARVSGAIAVDRRRRRTAVVAGVAAVAASPSPSRPCPVGSGGTPPRPPASAPRSSCPARRPALGARWRRGRPGGRWPRTPPSSPRRTNGWPRATRTTSSTPATWRSPGRRRLVGVHVDRRPHRAAAPRDRGPAALPPRTSSPASRKAPRPPRTSRWSGWACDPDSLLLVLTTPAAGPGEVSASATGQRRRFGDPDPVAAVELTDGAGVMALPDSPTFLTRVKVGLYDGQATGLVDGQGAVDPEAERHLPRPVQRLRRALRRDATTVGVAQQLGVPTQQVDAPRSSTPDRRTRRSPQPLASPTPTQARCARRRRQPGGRRGPAQRAAGASTRHGSSSESQELLTGVPLDALDPPAAAVRARGVSTRRASDSSSRSSPRSRGREDHLDDSDDPPQLDQDADQRRLGHHPARRQPR